MSKIGSHGGDSDGVDIKKTKNMEDDFFKISDQGMFMLVGIQNSRFKVEKQTWVLIDGDTSPQNSQPGLNIHAESVVDGMFYHYDGHDATLHQYPLLDLIGDIQEEQKYLLQIEKII